jgi:hypothetical protein
MDFVYACYEYEYLNKVKYRTGVSPSLFFTHEDAKKFASEHARFHEHRPGCEFWELCPKEFSNYYCVAIVKVQMGCRTNICDYVDDDTGSTKVMEIVYDKKTAAAMKIQKMWRPIYNKRIVAAFIIKKRMRHAIADPSTQMCRNRLLREFNEMV